MNLGIILNLDNIMRFITAAMVAVFVIVILTFIVSRRSAQPRRVISLTLLGWE